MTRADVSLLLAAFLSLAWSRPLEPLAPHTSRAVQSEWGEPYNGLSILAAIDSSTVPFGESFPVEVFFHFWPLLSDGRVRTLLEGGAGSLGFYLRNTETGVNYEGSPHLGRGFPIIARPEDGIPLRAGEFWSRREWALPCDWSGASLPVGEYELVARYSNKGGNGMETYPDPGGGPCYQRRPYPAGALWTGTVFSPPLVVRVPESRTILQPLVLPSAITIEWSETAERLTWNWSAASRDTLKVPRRLRHHLTFQVDRWAELDPPRPRVKATDRKTQVFRIERDRSLSRITTGSREHYVFGEHHLDALLPWRGDPTTPVLVKVELKVYESIARSRRGGPPRGDILLERTIEARWPGIEEAREE